MPDLSRTPTPTLPGPISLSDTEATTTTSVFSVPSDDSDGSDDSDESDESDEEEDEERKWDNEDYYLSRTRFNPVIASLAAITASSISPEVGRSVSDLRNYYSQKILSLLDSLEYKDAPMTDPPCPKIVINAVNVSSSLPENARLACPCCLNDDNMASLYLVAADTQGGVITYETFLRGLVGWLYDPAKSDLVKVVKGLQPGEAGVVKWNCMSTDRRADGAECTIMARAIYLYVGKPLEGGGWFESPKGGSSEEEESSEEEGELVKADGSKV